MRKLTTTALRERLPDWGVLMLESHHAPEFKMNWRTHNFLKIVFVLNGEGTFHFSETTIPFSAGDVVVVPPRTRNRIEDDPASAPSLYICCVATSILRFDSQLRNRFSTVEHLGEPQFANRVATLMRRMVHAQNRGGDDRPISMVGSTMRMLELILKQSRSASKTQTAQKRSPDRETVARYVKSLPHVFFEATSIDAAAASIRMSRRAFTKLFVEEAGETWLQCIRRLAIEHARTRLTETEMPVASIAFECGFNDLSTFYRQFKTQLGMPPLQFRKQTQK